MKRVITFIEAFTASVLYILIPVGMVTLFGWHPVFVFFAWAFLTGLVVLVLEGIWEDD